MFPWEVLITGAVGVGGTALGAWLNGRSQTKTLRLSLDAENERARLAQKRQIYANCMAAFSEVISAITLLMPVSSTVKHDVESLQAVRERYHKAADIMYKEVAILWLSAPRNIGRLANRFMDKFLEYEQAINDRASTDSIIQELWRLRVDLENALRADLGETD